MNLFKKNLGNIQRPGKFSRNIFVPLSIGLLVSFLPNSSFSQPNLIDLIDSINKGSAAGENENKMDAQEAATQKAIQTISAKLSELKIDGGGAQVSGYNLKAKQDPTAQWDVAVGEAKVFVTLTAKGTGCPNSLIQSTIINNCSGLCGSANISVSCQLNETGGDLVVKNGRVNPSSLKFCSSVNHKDLIGGCVPRDFAKISSP